MGSGDGFAWWSDNNANASPCTIGGGSVPATPAGTFPPIGNTLQSVPGVIWYANSNQAFYADGWNFLNGPRPNTPCDGLGFPTYGMGVGDGGGPNVANIVQAVLAGTGTTVWTISAYGSAGTVTYSFDINYQTIGSTQTITGPSGTLTLGQTITVPVNLPSMPAASTSCYRAVNLRWGSNPSGGPTGIAFGGMQWIP